MSEDLATGSACRVLRKDTRMILLRVFCLYGHSGQEAHTWRTGIVFQTHPVQRGHMIRISSHHVSALRQSHGAISATFLRLERVCFRQEYFQLHVWHAPGRASRGATTDTVPQTSRCLRPRPGRGGRRCERPSPFRTRIVAAGAAAHVAASIACRPMAPAIDAACARAGS